MLFNFDLQTTSTGLTDITAEVAEAVTESGVYEGVCVVFSPHTTASIMLGAEKNVQGNFSQSIIISSGRLLLGKHQRIYFCEKSNQEEQRKFYVKIM